MKNILLEYMNDRIQEEKNPVVKSGPFITISRQFGCSAKYIAAAIGEKLNEELQNKHENLRWQWFGKEIMLESARELNMRPEKIEQALGPSKKSLLSGLVSSFTGKFYNYDVKVRNSLSTVMRTFANEGYAILIGRGSCAITHGIANGLHIRLTAPLEWRANVIKKRFDCSEEEAIETILETDEKRLYFRKQMTKGKHPDSPFDITFNCESFSNDQIAQIVVDILKDKNLIS